MKKKRRNEKETERERERERREKWVSFVAFIGMELLVWDLTKNFNIDLETKDFVLVKNWCIFKLKKNTPYKVIYNTSNNVTLFLFL